MIVSQLVIYPIKGMSGISVPQVMLSEAGPVHDRRYMLVDGEGHFVSQRTDPALALCKVGLADDHMSIKVGGESIRFGLDKRVGGSYTVKVWDDDAIVHTVSPAVDDWLSRYVGKRFSLVTMADDTSRSHAIDGGPASTHVSLADGYPVLITGTASLDLLNSKLDVPIDMDRFRPNIVIQTEDPHVEDDFKEVGIGGAILQHVKPCVRCQVITIDQQSGVPSKEPLRTLATYRRAGKGVIFGSNYIVEQEGVVAVGDKLIC
jgi:uncharacterized protein YcbX